MKIAIAGKGGVGKTTLAALLARRFRDGGYSVIAVDADPDANLGASLGFPGTDNVRPIIEMKALIAERTGTEPGAVTTFFKLNPRVDDIPERYSALHEGIRLLVMGTVSRARAGCACPENTFMRTLLDHLLTGRDEVVIADMEAGLEHLGRATAESVDAFLLVTDADANSLATCRKIGTLAREMGVGEIRAVANKIEGKADRTAIREGLGEIDCLAFLPYSPELRASSRTGKGVLFSEDDISGEIDTIVAFLEERFAREEKGRERT